jgi:hypothetical protein
MWPCNRWACPAEWSTGGLEATQVGLKSGMEECTVLEPADLANEAVSRGLASQEQV